MTFEGWANNKCRFLLFSDYHHIFGAAAVIVSVCNAIYAVNLVYRGIVKPHAFTNFIWFFVAVITFFSLLDQGAGSAASRTAVLATALFINFVICFRNGFSYINRFDIGVFIMALVTIPLWIVTDDAELSLIWLMVVQVLGTIPMLRKGYALPYEMSAFIHFVTGVIYALQFLAIEVPTQGMVLYFTVLAMLFFFSTVMLLTRRFFVTEVKT